MPVNFFAFPCANARGNCQTNPHLCLVPVVANPFGVTDANGGTGIPAKVDSGNPPWDFTIQNNARINVTFKAVDWCVPIYRTGTYSLDDDNRDKASFSSDSTPGIRRQLIKRCEGFLQFDNKILFIEIKNRAEGTGGWLKDAREKFEETVLSFREHHPAMAAQVIEPVLSNPAFAKSHQNEMVQKRILKDKIGLEFKRQSTYQIS